MYCYALEGSLAQIVLCISVHRMDGGRQCRNEHLPCQHLLITRDPTRNNESRVFITCFAKELNMHVGNLDSQSHSTQLVCGLQRRKGKLSSHPIVNNKVKLTRRQGSIEWIKCIKSTSQSAIMVAFLNLTSPHS